MNGSLSKVAVLAALLFSIVMAATRVAGQSEKDPHRPPCTSHECQKIKAFLKSQYCGSSPMGNGPDDGCDTRKVKGAVSGTEVTADFVCEWNDAAEASRCHQEGQPSEEIRGLLMKEMRQLGLPAGAEKEIHFKVLESRSAGLILMAGEYASTRGSDLMLCQVIAVTDRRKQLLILKKVPLTKTDVDVPTVITWDPIDIADVDNDGNPEVILEGDAYENHWLEAVHIEHGSFETIFSGLGYYL